MKIQINPRGDRSGVALIMVLIMVGISMLVLSGTMDRSRTVSVLNQRNNDYIVLCNAAEAAVEKVYARMAYDFVNGTIGSVANNANTYRSSYPSPTDDAYWSKFQFSDGTTVNKTYVSLVGSYVGPLPSAYPGKTTMSAPVYRIVSNAKFASSRYNVVGTAQEDVLLALVPVSSKAIFYNGLLEFSQCATMTVDGSVHANGGIYVGTVSGNSLTFNGAVTTTATLSAPLVNGLTTSWTPTDSSSWRTTFTNNPGYVTNVPTQNVSLNMTNSHFLIDIPPDKTIEDPTSDVGKARLYNEAQLVILVTNAPSGSGIYSNPTVQLILQSSVSGLVPGNDPDKKIYTYTNASVTNLAANLPFLSVTNSLYDQREKKTNLITQIDIGRYNTWVSTNSVVQGKLPATSGIYPTIMYVGDRRNVAGKMPVVRVANAAQIPANGGAGFSIATMNPLYTLGDYNTKISGSSLTSAQTNNPANKYPSALLSDALTILSTNWTDAESYTAYSKGASVNAAANDTTINAAIVTGTMPSTGTSSTTFSGGVHNLPRLLEDWSGQDLWLNTSIIRLYDSNMATTQFRNPATSGSTPTYSYYNPPTRHYNFDKNFLDMAKVPPGIPTVLVPIRFAWGVPPPATVTYSPGHN